MNYVPLENTNLTAFQPGHMSQLRSKSSFYISQRLLVNRWCNFIRWEIDATDAKPMPNTLLYTSYMLRVVATRPHAEGLAVLLPCFWVYMHVGKCMLKLRENLGDR